jgi:CheY-like chemotaxis protein
MSGFQFSNILKSNEKNSKIPLIAYTSLAKKSEEDEIKRLFYGFLSKPILKDNLIFELKKFLKYEFVENTSNHNLPNLSEKNISFYLSTLDSNTKSEFAKIISPKIHRLKERMVTKLIDELIADFQFFGEKYELDFFKHYSKLLKDELERFNIAGLKELVNEIKF